MKNTIAILIAIGTGYMSCFAQLVTYQTAALQVQNNYYNCTVSSNETISSVSIEFPAGFLKNHSASIYCEEQQNAGQVGVTRVIHLQIDEHLITDVTNRTALVMLPRSCNSFLIQSSVAEKESLLTIPIKVILLHVPSFQVALSAPVLSRSMCDSPSWIPQSVWRTGLPDPVKGRAATPTEHCIVHHSASGNGDTNYTDLVRNYYTYHTTVNGWDDIGYNFLIAANGDIYAGRDPEKPGIRQDDVQGAHFCSKNSLTMGTCVMGDFTSVKPSALAIQSLIRLLSWKISIDSLDPFGSYNHPTSSDPLLAVIAGHRDGCATQCPGDSLYVMLPDIRNQLKPCAKINGLRESELPELRVKTLENGWIITDIPVGLTAELYNVSGKLIDSRKSDINGAVAFSIPNQCIGILRIVSSNGQSHVLKLYHR